MLYSILTWLNIHMYSFPYLVFSSKSEQCKIRFINASLVQYISAFLNRFTRDAFFCTPQSSCGFLEDPRSVLRLMVNKMLWNLAVEMVHGLMNA